MKTLVEAVEALNEWDQERVMVIESLQLAVAVREVC